MPPLSIDLPFICNVSPFRSPRVRRVGFYEVCVDCEVSIVQPPSISSGFRACLVEPSNPQSSLRVEKWHFLALLRAEKQRQILEPSNPQILRV